MTADTAQIDKYRAIDPGFVAPKTQPDAHRAISRARTSMSRMRGDLKGLNDSLKGHQPSDEEMALYYEERAQLRGNLLTIERHYNALKQWTRDHYARRPGAELSGVLMEDLFAELRRRSKTMEEVVSAAVVFVQAEQVRQDGSDEIHDASRHLEARAARLQLCRAVMAFLDELPDEEEDGSDG